VIKGPDLISWRGISRSNHDRWLEIGWLRVDREAAAVQNRTPGGAVIGAHRRSLYPRYGPWFSMRIGPTASQWWVQSVLAYLVWRWLELRTRDDGRLAPWIGVHDKLLRWCSGSVLPFYGSGWGRRSLPRPRLGTGHGEVSGDWRFWALGFWWVSSKSELQGLLYIGVFGPWRTQQDYEVDPISNWGLNWLLIAIWRGILDEHGEGQSFLRWWRLPIGDNDGLGWHWPLGREVGCVKRKGGSRLGWLQGWGRILAHGQLVIENPFKFSNLHCCKFKIDLNFAWILIVKLNLIAHNNRKEKEATIWMQQP
jgi:hypothetical protein